MFRLPIKNPVLFLSLVGCSLLLTLSCSDVTNISKEQLEKHSSMLNGKESNFIINKEDKPLFVLNGKIIEEDQVKRYKPEYIQSIEVIKGNKAIELYGDEGKNGVINISADKKILTDLKPEEKNGKDSLFPKL